jgi:hypothetical protein
VTFGAPVRIALDDCGGPFSRLSGSAENRPPVDVTAKCVRRTACAGRRNSDLERTTADAIVLAMTSSVCCSRLARARQVRQRLLSGKLWRTTLGSKSTACDQPANPTHTESKENLLLKEPNCWPDCSARKLNRSLRLGTRSTPIADRRSHLCCCGFVRGRKLCYIPLNDLGSEQYSRHLVDVKSRIPHIVILPSSARTKKVNRGGKASCNLSLLGLNHGRRQPWESLVPERVIPELVPNVFWPHPGSDCSPAVRGIQRPLTVQQCGLVWIMRKTGPGLENDGAGDGDRTRDQRLGKP